MKNISIKQMQDIIASNLPETFNQELKRNSGMFYQVAKPIKIKGKFPLTSPKTLKRTLGYSGDRLFNLELVGNPDNLEYIEFSSWAETLVLARNLVPIIAAIKSIYSEWDNGRELAIAVETAKATPLDKELRTRIVKLDGFISISKALLVNGVEAVFVRVK